MLPTNMGDIIFPITYINQIIPSLYNFPVFEMEITISKTLFYPTHPEVTGSIDLSGARVEVYAHRVVIANIAAKMRKIIPFSIEPNRIIQHSDHAGR